MSKNKGYEEFNIVEKNNKPNTLNVVWDCADKEGYGVEYSDNETIIASWSFGDNSMESFILSEKLFDYAVDVLSELTSKQVESKKDPNLPFVEVSLPSELISAMFSIENGKPTKRDNDDVLCVVQILEKHFGQHPLKEYAEENRKNIQSAKEKGLWTSLIQHSA